MFIYINSAHLNVLVYGFVSLSSYVYFSLDNPFFLLLLFVTAELEQNSPECKSITGKYIIVTVEYG